MLRLLLFVCFSLGVVPQLFGQPGGGPGTGGQGVCRVPVLRDCVTISGYVGRCIDTASHSCEFDFTENGYRCNPRKGVDVVEHPDQYIVAIPAAPLQSGFMHWVWEAADPCGMLEVCACDGDFRDCLDIIETREPWGPGNWIADPSIYGIPPVPDCVGQ